MASAPSGTSGKAGKRTADQSTRGDEGLAKAMSSPTRLRILAMLTEDGVASPKQLARRLGEPLENVAYHVKVLRETDCIELVDTKQRRGATEHFYRAITRAFISDEASSDLDTRTRSAMSATVLQQCFRLIFDATSQGTFDSRSDRHLSYVSLTLTEQGWNEVNQRLHDVLELAMGLQSAGLEAERNGEDVTHSTLVVTHFPTPEPG